MLLPALQVMLVEFYKGAPDLVKFQEAWSSEHTYLDKLKVRRGPVGSTRPQGHNLKCEQQSSLESQERLQDLGGWVRALVTHPGA